MRHSYVRFVTEVLDGESGRRRGVFQAMYDLLDSSELAPHERDELEGHRKWFAANLKVPDRFAWAQRTGAARRAIGWFKCGAAEHVSRVRSICRILGEHGIATEMITSARPGYVVYEDEHQVAAIPFAETTT